MTQEKLFAANTYIECQLSGDGIGRPLPNAADAHGDISSIARVSHSSGYMVMSLSGRPKTIHSIISRNS